MCIYIKKFLHGSCPFFIFLFVIVCLIYKNIENWGKCLKRWRSVNQQIICYTNYIIVWGTFYSYNSACIPGVASLTMAGNYRWSPDAPDGGCLASRSEDISDRCKHPVHWVWHSLLMYIIPHWPLLPWEYPQTARLSLLWRRVWYWLHTIIRIFA